MNNKKVNENIIINSPIKVSNGVDKTEEIVSSNDESADEIPINIDTILKFPLEEEDASFTNVKIDRSSDVHIGPRLHYSGPVIINQYLNNKSETNNNNNNNGTTDIIKNDPIHEGLHTTNGSSFYNNSVINNSGHLPASNHVTTTTSTTTTLPDLDYNSFGQQSFNLIINKGRRFQFAILFFIIGLLVASISVGISLNLPINNVRETTTISIPNNTSMHLSTSSMSLHIYSKNEWRGLDAREVHYMLKPASFVIISHTVTTQCYNFSKCAEKLQAIQNYHLSKGYTDIGHNFLINLQGDIYEGRGWDVINMHTGIIEGCNIAIGVIGNFVVDYPSKQMMDSVKNLIELGIKLNKIVPNYHLISHNEIQRTESPGKNIINEIKNWKHYISDLNSMKIENCEIIINNRSLEITTEKTSTTINDTYNY